MHIHIFAYYCKNKSLLLFRWLATQPNKGRRERKTTFIKTEPRCVEISRVKINSPGQYKAVQSSTRGGFEL